MIEGRVVDAGEAQWNDAGGLTAACRGTASAGDTATCASALQGLQRKGFCGTACEDVAAVCPFLNSPVDGENFWPTCFGVAAGTDEDTCAMHLPLEANDCNVGGTLGPCGGSTGVGAGGPTCSSLAACCPLLTGGLPSACYEVAAEGYEPTCASFLSYAQALGSCRRS